MLELKWPYDLKVNKRHVINMTRVCFLSASPRSLNLHFISSLSLFTTSIARHTAMSRLQKHRKSQSTSALSVIADGGVSVSGDRERRSKLRASQHPALGRVEEGLTGKLPSVISNEMPKAGTPRMSRAAEGAEQRRHESKVVGEKSKSGKSVCRGVGEDSVKGWLSDVSDFFGA
jgi:hypothetical protein